MYLPLLRQDLLLLPAAQERDGAPAWLIHDPIRNLFFRIGWLEFELLARWERAKDCESLSRIVSEETPLEIDAEDARFFAGFLVNNQLTRMLARSAEAPDSPGAAAARSLPFWKWLVHNYLFFRIPLIYPDGLLNRLGGLVRGVVSLPVLLVLAAIAVNGMLSIARAPDHYFSSFQQIINLKGAVSFVLALSIGKIVHELGHILVSKRFGVRVPRAGVAFLVMFPVLYTDTSESWKLDARKRLLIASAGIFTELALAGGAATVWGLLPDGDLRLFFFVLSSVSLVSSLAVNVSPFMRFDGYYILSDLLNIPNLQPRSFSLARTLLRRTFLGTGEAYAEYPGKTLFRFMTCYAFATWLYRLVVFTGIALAVYHFFFKLLGIVLMMVEVWYFIAAPIVREGASWFACLRTMPKRRKRLLALAAVSLLLLLFFPFGKRIPAEAVFHAGEKQAMYAPFPARLTYVVKNGTQVDKGAVLFRFDASQYRFQVQQSRIQLQSLLEMERKSSYHEKDKETISALSRKIAEKRQELASYLGELGRLEIVAERSGVVLDVDPGLRPFDMVGSKEPLGVLVSRDSAEVDAFVDEKYLDLIQEGAAVTCYFRAGNHSPVKGTVAEIDRGRTALLPYPMLAKKHGGTIATQPSSSSLVPVASLYRVRILLAEKMALPSMQSGVARIAASPESIAVRVCKAVYSGFLRESGF